VLVLVTNIALTIGIVTSGMDMMGGSWAQDSLLLPTVRADSEFP
jgi:hypothetical protein